MSARVLAAFFAIVALAGVGWGFDQHRRLATDAAFDHRRAELLLAENDRLRALVAEQKKQAAQTAPNPQRDAIEKAVAQIRELKFLQPVVFDVVSHATIKATLEKKIAEQYSDAEIKDLTHALAALGLLERNYPLKQKL